MPNVKVVTGANFGDEGKGLMTDYFAHNAVINNKSPLVICTNGGAQRGHTVVTPQGVRHIFHHFGSGVLTNTPTYLSDSYIVNPLIFCKERAELLKLNANTRCFINPDCIVSTPYDMLVNQALEIKRDKNRHGSCGYGIYETIKRERVLGNSRMKDLVTSRIPKLKTIRDYAFKRLKDNDINLKSPDMPCYILECFENDQLLENFSEDFHFMLSNTHITDDSIATMFDTLIFENAQGLLLDMNNLEYFPHLTPTSTNNTLSRKFLDGFSSDFAQDIEICYVTRSYLTRHGAGRLDTECSKECINATMCDQTNVTNSLQGEFRYGYLDISELEKRIHQDMKGYRGYAAKASIAVTHLNETNNMLATSTGDVSPNILSKYNLYLSFAETRDYINQVSKKLQTV